VCVCGVCECGVCVWCVCGIEAVTTGQISTGHIPGEACKRAVVLLAVVSPLLDLLHGMIQGRHLPRLSCCLELPRQVFHCLHPLGVL